MPIVFLSLGSNLGNRRRLIEEMAQKCGRVLDGPMARSQLMATEPVGMPGQQRWFVNLLIRGRFPGRARELLLECNRIEDELGRTRATRWAARTADIDILLFGHEIIHDRRLVVPHPRILQRRFCLEGLRQVCPFFIVPGTGKTVMEHFCTMDGQVRRQKIIFMKNGSPEHQQGRPR